ncbi:MAG: hypothetical protein JWM74_3672 [Myxococcaceae bacterium]|nr:hypothetical protein [Myxococcaceae bacterium]
MLAGAGCASERPAGRAADIGSSAAETRAARETTVTDRRATLRLAIEGLAPVPLVHATVGRVTTWMQIDSGASAQTLPGFLVRRAELAREPRASSIAIDAWGRLDDGPLAVREQDEELPGARAGIAGLLSPQRLLPAGALVLDLPRREMRAATEREAMRALSSQPTELTAGAERCDGMYVVGAFIEGVHARLIVDTGAAATALYARSRAGAMLDARSVESRGRSFSVDGAMTTRTVEAAKILAGDVHAVHDVTLLSGARAPAGDAAMPCAEDGVLGIDVLGACVLVFGPGLRIRCG